MSGLVYLFIYFKATGSTQSFGAADLKEKRSCCHSGSFSAITGASLCASADTNTKQLGLGTKAACDEGEQPPRSGRSSREHPSHWGGGGRWLQ